MKIDLKVLSKAMMWTGGLMTLAFGVAMLTKWLGDGFLLAFNVIFLVTLFYHILKDQRFFAHLMRFFALDFCCTQYSKCDKQEQCIEMMFFVTLIFCYEQQIVCGMLLQYGVGSVVFNPLFFLPLHLFFSMKKYIHPRSPGDGGGKILFVYLT